MITPKGRFRHLTAGEVLLSRMIFGDSICYARVRVYNKKWIPVQRNNFVMTPNGNMCYPEGMFREGFSDGGHPADSGQHLFMHEMVHVWQYQRGYHVKSSGIFSFNKSRCRYELSEDNRLFDYGMEAQGNLLADYFWLKKYGLHGINRLFEEKYRAELQNTLLSLYAAVLVDFIKNPHDESNLPGKRNRQRESRRARSFREGCPR